MWLLGVQPHVLPEQGILNHEGQNTNNTEIIIFMKTSKKEYVGIFRIRKEETKGP